MIKLIAGDFTLDAAQGDQPRRTISGIAAPYNVPAVVSDGTAVIFRPGSLPVEGKAPRLFMYHDASQPVGVVTERVDTEQGMMFSAKISATTLGNDALVMAADGTIDQVSVGVNPTKFSYDEEGTMIIEAADWMELSLVPIGAFGDMANISKVAASIHQESDEVVLNENVTPVEEKPEMSEATVPAVEATIPTAPIHAQAKRKFDLPTPGEYLAAMHIGGETFRNVSAAASEYMISKQSAFQAAAGDVLTTDTLGLLPVPVLGPVVENLNQSLRPVVAAIGARAMPDGGSQKTFIRPTWTTHTSVAAQANELDSVSATTPVIAANVITKTTLAGQVQLSVQDVDFTSPGAMEIIVQDLVGQYMQASDNLAADGLVAGSNVSGATWTVTANDPTTLITSIYTCAYSILVNSNFLPDHIFVDPQVWRSLGGQLDADLRPVFPYAGANGLIGMNAMGAANVTVASTFNPFGLAMVADRNFANNTMIVARAKSIEFYEQIKGLTTWDDPRNLGKIISFHGYASLFVGDTKQVQKIAIA
jgi:HK97 family phage prohead protease